MQTANTKTNNDDEAHTRAGGAMMKRRAPSKPRQPRAATPRTHARSQTHAHPLAHPPAREAREEIATNHNPHRQQTLAKRTCKRQKNKTREIAGRSTTTKRGLTFEISGCEAVRWIEELELIGENMELKQIKEHIEALKDGESFIWPESDYGRAEIWRKNEMYFVWEIPMYGGVPHYNNAYTSAHDLMDVVEQWT